MRWRLRPLIFLPASMPWLVSATFADVFTLCASTTAAVGPALWPCARRVLSRSGSRTCWVVPSDSHFRPYRSDVSDARWAWAGPGTAARVHDLREIVNAILYVNRTGIPWEYLRHDFPPFKTVYDYYADEHSHPMQQPPTAPVTKTSQNTNYPDQKPP
ncbi:putative secreted protein [Streptomyces avermitilis MA-4680 = NBRC 14893]|uniref:Secreted protein n=1 Tax=Streptomyces avermitilis (strain ATCC 31267 / DSM 46492 / JCM 5070 / NBRC 14893 / NCIMB 12804 / NRRL 8165 / MA-4680) TaxID=227882 RepID=Q82Q32_STRAW|nr:putative secreted protein [Streptomyces avermitilis MA-4680 = NBRC 14893]